MNPFRSFLILSLSALLIFSGMACTQHSKPNEDSSAAMGNDSLISSVKDSSGTVSANDTSSAKTAPNEVKPVVLIYNFHVTNRCVSCIAIEEATTKTLNTYFMNELKQGRIKRKILNVDDEANAKIAEKYQAFGSGVFVTRVMKGKETTTDLTGDGFKFAKNKEERFIEILKNKITEYLK